MITFDFVPRAGRRNGFRVCAVCLAQFRGRKHRVICGTRECRAEHMRRFHAGTLRIPKPQEQFLVCACGARFVKSHGNRKHCTRCIALTTKIPARKRQVESMLTVGQDALLCACGKPAYAGTDFLGRTTVECGVHVMLMPLVLPKDFVRHTQRAELDAELGGIVERAGKAIAQTAPSRNGNAFRQRTHKT